MLLNKASLTTQHKIAADTKTRYSNNQIKSAVLDTQNIKVKKTHVVVNGYFFSDELLELPEPNSSNY